MKPYHKNPRKISPRQLAELEKWLVEFGDLSGVVHDLNSDEIIGGNQRWSIFDLGEYEIILDEKSEIPDEQGTVATGYIYWEGEEYTYRQVRWTAEKCERANIIANKAGGDFDFDLLAQRFSASILLQAGFKEYEFVTFTEPGQDKDHGETIKLETVSFKVKPEVMERFKEMSKIYKVKSDTERFLQLFQGIL